MRRIVRALERIATALEEYVVLERRFLSRVEEREARRRNTRTFQEAKDLPR